MMARTLFALPFPLPDALGQPTSVSRPAPEMLVADAPEHRSWDLEIAFDRTLFAGVWDSDPGEFRMLMKSRWEFCHLLSGALEIAEDGAAPRTIRPGETFVMQPGFAGTWRVTETSRKVYVLRKG
jgi:uncharacterized cupin superfamily protein